MSENATAVSIVSKVAWLVIKSERKEFTVIQRLLQIYEKAAVGLLPSSRVAPYPLKKSS